MKVVNYLRRVAAQTEQAERRRDAMSVDFTVACPECGHTLTAVANPGNPYDWDWEDCICQTRTHRTKARS